VAPQFDGPTVTQALLLPPGRGGTSARMWWAGGIGGRRMRTACTSSSHSRMRAESRGGRGASMVVGRAREPTTNAGPAWDEEVRLSHRFGVVGR
jgi:hypothetical protein